MGFSVCSFLVMISMIFFLVVVVVVFFVCWVLFYVERMMMVFISVWMEFFFCIYWILFYVLGIFYFINCMVNLVFYSVMFFKFRKGLCEMILKFKCCCRFIKIRKRFFFFKFLYVNSYIEMVYILMLFCFINIVGWKL